MAANSIAARRQTLVNKVHERLIDRSAPDADDSASPTAAPELRTVAAEVGAVAPLLDHDHARDVVAEVASRLAGVGQLAELFVDDAITEVMINGPGPVVVERGGQLEQVAVISEAEVLRLVEYLLGPTGRRVDRRTPIVDVRLDDRTRCNVVVPPVAVDGPYVTLRRFPRGVRPLAEFAQGPLLDRLEALVSRRANVVVYGATSTGKTSLVASSLATLGTAERVVVIEEAAELPRHGANFVRLEAQPPNVEGVGGVSLAQLVVAALRLRPDRLLVGEVRGGEAAELLHVLSTGHRGSFSTLHAESPDGALWRLEQLARMGGAVGDVRAHLLNAVDALIRVERLGNGDRRVADIYEVEPAPAGNVR